MMISTNLVLVLLLMTIICLGGGFCSHNQTDGDLRLHRYLFEDYNIYVRPVRNSSAATRVILRQNFKSLLHMTWRDQYLTWDPADFDGIAKHVVPVSQIWTPDITLQDNADLAFEREKSGTLAIVYADGTVIWFVPTIYTGTCIVNIKWFPFDVQTCEMVFSSWAYDGFAIDLHPENSEDASTLRYEANGVWDMVTVRWKRIVQKYLCCPEPYPELHFLLVFKRHPGFYINYMVLPCLFLSILSLLVFYLPPDCGEKLTLSITNLLALVVFQQIIAEHMPPTSEQSPVIGTYFICMIVMVCMSVIATGIVMHLSAVSQPVPIWVKRVFLQLLPRVLCLSPGSFEDVNDKSSFRRTTVLKGNVKEQLGNGIKKIKGEGQITTKTAENGNWKSSKDIQEALDTLRLLKKDIVDRNAETLEHLQWRRVSVVVDRLLLILFSLYMVTCTSYLTLMVVFGSEEEYEDINRSIEEENW